MLRRFAVGSTVLVHMRFDGSGEGEAQEAVRYKKLPSSMQPKPLPNNFTPFPLPKYDEDLGFGPVRLRNIPDIEKAKQREKQKEVAVMESIMEGEMGNEQLQESSTLQLQTKKEEKDEEILHSFSSEELSFSSSSGDALGGYSVSSDYPLIDRLYCERSLEDLLSQFMDRPQVEARSAALADMASTIQHRTDEELVRMFEEISSPFTPDGRGLNFLGTVVRKYGRPFRVTTSLLTAYVNLVNAASVVFVQEQPWRLSNNPKLIIQLLHFMALIKIFEPNKWFTFSNHAPSNRADYKHPRGTNKNTAFWCTGEDLFDHMLWLIEEGEGEEKSLLLDLCSNDQLVDLLNGFAAVMPDGKAIGSVFNSIMKIFVQRIQMHPNDSWKPEDIATIERMYFTSVMADSSNKDLLKFLLNNTIYPRGADFFAAVSRERDEMVHEKALSMLQESIDKSNKEGDTSTLLALLESGSELLLSISNKDIAYNFAMRNEFDQRILKSFTYFDVIAEKLQVEQSRISAQIPVSLRDVQVQLCSSMRENVLSASETMKTSLDSLPNYLAKHPKRRFSQSLRTMLSQLEYLNSMDSVFLLHSSLMTTSTDQLISAVRRLPTGKDSLIVTSSCLRELSVKSFTSPKIKEREACKQALEIIAYELEKGRVVLVPFSEEIRLHDAGAYCDEDLMLWSIAAFFARELPLVKVHTLMHSDCTARTPYRFLKGQHHLLSSTNSLYDKDAPLLSALYSKELKLVTHHTKLRTAVRDRVNTLHYYNPVRARFVYRRDKALFDKYHVTARNLAPGFSRGGLKHDWRGLGVYTPDHPQVPYTPITKVQSEESSVNV
ncbi:uncharacterized protein TM35_000052860 [Trypanosoma theileri]|uniref:Uncharacterized protein n=1 Tax=Trypanosoma theileri TaxID=67003 RepID=A0A1X0P5I8_9TRYP|nr:uncharacterized protein TM35_000052860 [Trypanosoma theileri]ORC91690.1 hypothetical protein TM35_000052860 [Trypanosoma theileri]